MTQLPSSILIRYQKALAHLENSEPSSLSPEQALEVLLARDALEKILQTEVQVSAPFVLETMALDNRLKQQAQKIKRGFNLIQEYRQNSPSPSENWWWYLDTYLEDSHLWNRFDGLLRGARFAVWTFNLALLGTLITRLLSGGTGLVGAAAIAFSAIFPLLQARSELTKGGKEEVKLILTLLMTGLLLGIWLIVPPLLARINYRQGAENQTNQQLAKAEQKYLKAIELATEYPDAHYNLGVVYEDWQDFENAKKHYLIAAKGGLPDAYNNLARLYILKNNDAEAVNLIKQGLDLIEIKERPGNLTQQAKNELKAVQYSLLKNLGWARLEQGRMEEAQQFLQVAIELPNNLDAQFIRNRGATYCLLAQVQPQEKSQVRQYWQRCRDLLDSQTTQLPEEDTWLYRARQALQEVK